MESSLHKPAGFPDVNRVIGYVLSAIIASLFYVTWLLVEEVVSPTPRTSFMFNLGFAVFFWLTGGFCVTLGVMALPWIPAVRAFPALRLPGPVYFGGIGALLTLIVGCAATSLSPKPFWIEEQSLFEGFLICAQRQGICLFLAGLIFGFNYWFLSERHRVPQN
jgi:hypothetical protein